MRRLILLGVITFSLMLSACAKESSASEVIESYLKAKVDSDAEKLVALACADYEAEATLDADSFAGLNAKIQGLTCTESGTEGDSTLVTCNGTLQIEYRGEEPRTSPLDDTVYLARKVGGEWKMCGQR